MLKDLLEHKKQNLQIFHFNIKKLNKYNYKHNYKYIDKLDNIVSKYNNKYHIAIKMKPVRTHVDLNIEKNDKDPKFKIDDHVRISKYKNILQKFALQICLNKPLWLKRLRHCANVNYMLNGKTMIIFLTVGLIKKRPLY